MSNERIYCCYSKNLKDYLYHYGIRYGCCGLNPNSQKLFWGYVKTPELDKLLDKWSDEAKRYNED